MPARLGPSPQGLNAGVRFLMSMTDHAQEPNLRDYLGVLRRRRAVIALCVLIVVGAALASSFLQSPVYQGTAEVLLEPRPTEALFENQQTQPADPVRAI